MGEESSGTGPGTGGSTPEAPEAQEAISLDSAVEGRRYLVRWDDCCAQGYFISVLESKNYVPDPPDPAPFLDSLKFANGVTVSRHGVSLQEAGINPGTG